MIIKKKFNELTLEELFEICRLRMQVFVLEQKITEEEELDDEDYNCIHYYIKDSKKIISYARLITNNHTPIIGRVCTHINYRNMSYSSQIIEEIKKEYTKLEISAQVRVIPFYEKLGFRTIGNIYLEAGIEHQKMTFN